MQCIVYCTEAESKIKYAVWDAMPELTLTLYARVDFTPSQ